jgi:hypothetical protein
MMPDADEALSTQQHRTNENAMVLVTLRRR